MKRAKRSANEIRFPRGDYPQSLPRLPPAQIDLDVGRDVFQIAITSGDETGVATLTRVEVLSLIEDLLSFVGSGVK